MIYLNVSEINGLHLPEAVEYVIKKIMKNGGQAYLVGGALRDHILGIKDIFDYDIATSLAPERIEIIFSNHSIWTAGKRFGTISLKVDDMSIEITTFRKEAAYTDNRHPDSVSFVTDIHQDLSRRDFTINAMAYNPFITEKLIDPFNGKEDIKNRIIRAVGDPQRRFEEDPLRMMRGIRFLSQLDFKLDVKTKNAIHDCYQKLENISSERLQDELNKLILSSHPEKGLILLLETGILPLIFRFDNLEDKKADFQLIRYISSDNLTYRLAALLVILFEEELSFTVYNYNTHINMSIIKNRLIKLRYDKKTIDHTLNLLQGYFSFLNMKKVKPYNIKKLLGQTGEENMLQILRWADKSAELKKNKVLHDKCINTYRIIKHVLEKGEPIYFHQLALKGDDILNAGIGTENKKIIGEALNYAYDLILKKPGWNRKDYLIQMIKKRFSSDIDT